MLDGAFWLGGPVLCFLLIMVYGVMMFGVHLCVGVSCVGLEDWSV